MKTADLKGSALDWAVAKCEGELDRADYYLHESTGAFMLEKGEVSALYSPSTKWNQGGPIIEREKIDLLHVRQADLSLVWVASIESRDLEDSGPTPLIAAMRCYVASELGDEVKLPKDLK